jgi:hypothetical protein
MSFVSLSACNLPSKIQLDIGLDHAHEPTSTVSSHIQSLCPRHQHASFICWYISFSVCDLPCIKLTFWPSIWHHVGHGWSKCLSIWQIISDLFKRMRWGSGWMLDVSVSFGRFRPSFTFESSVREMRNDDSWRHPCCPWTPAILFLLYRKVR